MNRLKKMLLLSWVTLMAYGCSCDKGHDKDIVYQLSPAITKFIEDSLIKDYPVSSCFVTDRDDKTTFSFTLTNLEDDPEIRSKKIISSSKRFIRLRNELIPVTFSTDYMYSDFPREGRQYNYHPLHCYISIDYNDSITDVYCGHY